MSFYTISIILHSLLRWPIIILLIINIIRHFSAINKPFTSSDNKLGLWLMICAHITLLLGLYQYFSGSYGFSVIEANGMKEVMQNNVERYWAVEHFAGMLIAIILITIGKGVAKKNITDKAKHTRAAWLFLIAFIIILATVPWPYKEAGIARPLFPALH